MSIILLYSPKFAIFKKNQNELRNGKKKWIRIYFFFRFPVQLKNKN